MARAGNSRNTKMMDESYLLELLEPRIMLSADPFGAAEVAVDLLMTEQQQNLVEYEALTPDETETNAASVELDSLDIASVTTLFASQDPLFGNQQAYSQQIGHLQSILQSVDGDFVSTLENENSRTELIFIDAGVSNQQQLLHQIIPSDSSVNYQVHYLDQSSEGLSQISQLLGQYSQIDALHIISHGQSDGVQLGSSWVDADSLQQNEDQITQWSSVLTADADILLYGCDVASSEAGIDFVQTLQRLSGADIAASDDKTGAQAQGGDWDLEYQSGVIESQLTVSVDAQQNWQGVLASFVVNTTADTINGSDGLLSLREAIIAANANPDDDTIILNAGTYNLTIVGSGEDSANTGDLDIRRDLTIIGADAATTIINGAAMSDRIFDVYNPNTDFNLSNLTLQNGNAGAQDGGAIRVLNSNVTVNLDHVIISGNAADAGGGIYSIGTLNMTDSVIEGNTTSTSEDGWGGGLLNDGAATLERVTVSGNTAAHGGGIYNNDGGSSMTLTNVTVSSNSANSFTPPFPVAVPDGRGGGLYASSGTVDIVNSTFTLNIASINNGGGIYAKAGATVELQNTIVADNKSTVFTLQNDVSGSFVSSGNNLIGKDSSSTGWGASDMRDASAGLGALADNGGFGQTHALLGGSLAIDAGNNTSAPTIDQRGVSRPQDGDGDMVATVDIGAFEFSSNSSPTAVPGGPYTIIEGGTLNLDASASSDSDGTIVSWEWDIGNNGSFEKSGETISYNWADLNSAGVNDDGSVDAALRVTDNIGATSTQVFSFTVDNVAPLLSVSGGTSVDEDVAYNFDLIFTDPGAETLTWFVNWGDGTLTNHAATGNTTSVTHTYQEYSNGHTRNITVSARDEDGEYSLSDLLATGIGSGYGGGGSDGIFRFNGVTGSFVSAFDDLGNAVISDPIEVVMGPDGKYYVSGNDSDNILRFNADGSYFDEFVTPNLGGLNEPAGMAFGSDGKLYVASGGSNQILRYNVDGSFDKIFGTSGAGMNEPGGIAFGPDGDLYATSWGNGKIYKFDGATGGAPTVVVSSGLAGPEQIYFDASGNLFIADTSNNRIAKYDGISLTTFTSGTAPVASGGLVAGPDGSWYAASGSNDSVLKYDAAGSFDRVFVSSGAGGLNGTLYLSFTPAHQVLINSVNDEPTGSVTISGTAAEDQTLTASNTLADEDGLGTITYTWKADDTTVGTGSTYLLTQNEVGKTITVEASYTDGGSTAEMVASSATAAVTNVNDIPVILTNTLSLNQGSTLVISSLHMAASDTDYDDALLVFNLSSVTNGYFALSSDISNAITSFTQSQITAGVIVFVHDGGELAPAYDVSVSDGALTSELSSASITFTGTADGVLWLSIDGNEGSSNGIPGLNSSNIDKGDILQQAGPDYAMGEGTTDGSLSVAFDISAFSPDDTINGLHYVTSNITIGQGNVVNLQAGDVLLSSSGEMTLTSNGVSAPVPGTAQKEDVFYFRPDQPGDYSTGNFYLLFTEGMGTGEEIRAISLVESSVTVGDYMLEAGDVLFSRAGGTAGNDIWLFRTSTIDMAAGTSDYPTALKLIEGNNAGAGFGANISGLDVLESDLVIGGQAHDAGAILVSFDADDTSVGTTSQSVTKHDVVALNVSQTTLGLELGSAQVEASVLFDGSGVGFDSDNEALDGFSLTSNVTSTNTPPTLDANNFVLSEGVTTTITAAMLAASDANDSDAGLVFNISLVSGGQFELVSNAGVAITAFTQNQITLADVVFVDNGDETAPTFSLSVSDGVNLTTAVAGTINFSNTNDAPTGSVTLSGDGTPAENETLTASNTLADEDGLGTIVYHWQRNGSDIGSTGSSYTLVDADVGQTITVEARYTDARGANEAVLSNSITGITNVNDAPTGSISITSDGTPAENETLTASNTLADEDGLGTIVYHWQRNGSDIGSTGSSYTLVDADVGQMMTVEARYTDARGANEAVLSNSITGITNVNDAPTGSVSITSDGTPAENETLTASNTLADEDGLGTIVYHWQRNGSDIGSTGSNYTLVDADVGQTMTVEARYTDLSGVQERVASLPLVVNKAVSEVVVSIADTTVSVSEEIEPSVVITESEEEVKELKAQPVTNMEEDVQQTPPEVTPLTPIHAPMVIEATAELPVFEPNEIKTNNIIKPLALAIGNQTSVMTGLKASWLELSDPFLLVNSSGLMNGLDEMEREFQKQIGLDQMVAGSSIAMSTSLSVGYVAWLLRSGVLLSSVLTSLPAWRFVDPLPILSKLDSEEGEFDVYESGEESLEELVQKDNNDETSDTKDQ